jgi:hypothetical protein
MYRAVVTNPNGYPILNSSSNLFFNLEKELIIMGSVVYLDPWSWVPSVPTLAATLTLALTLALTLILNWS